MSMVSGLVSVSVSVSADMVVNIDVSVSVSADIVINIGVSVSADIVLT